jgi:hypothetical protein
MGFLHSAAKEAWNSLNLPSNSIIEFLTEYYEVSNSDE